MSARRAESGKPVDNATLVAQRDVGPSARLLEVDLDEPLRNYRPGQYVALGLRGMGGLVQRPYSVVSLTGGGRRVELFVRNVPGGALTPILWEVACGSRVRLGPPRGAFILDPLDANRLFVGAGTGIAPILAMVEAAVQRANGVPATLIHGVSYAEELVFDERLGAWLGVGAALDYRPTISRPADARNRGWTGRVGRAEDQLASFVASDHFSAQATTAYVCGNPQMVEACVATLVACGTPPVAIKTERF